ncbi:cell division inhibitor SidA [Phenylobacterium sp.]
MVIRLALESLAFASVSGFVWAVCQAAYLMG